MKHVYQLWRGAEAMTVVLYFFCFFGRGFGVRSCLISMFKCFLFSALILLIRFDVFTYFTNI